MTNTVNKNHKPFKHSSTSTSVYIALYFKTVYGNMKIEIAFLCPLSHMQYSINLLNNMKARNRPFSIKEQKNKKTPFNFIKLKKHEKKTE